MNNFQHQHVVDWLAWKELRRAQKKARYLRFLKSVEASHARDI